MSIEAINWATEFAPPLPSQLLPTLTALAKHADRDGTGAYPSVPRLAALACKSERSVRRDLRQLEELKLIRKGDQRLVQHLPADKRPEVYDLALDRTVPKGRAGDDEETRTSARTLVSSRERGRAAREAKKASSDDTSDSERGDVDVRGDADVRADVDVQSGGTWTSAATGRGRPPKGSLKGPLKGGRENATEESPSSRSSNGLHPLPDDFTLNDAMRRWSLNTFGPGLDVDHETKQFISHFRAEGVRKKSWPDAWQKWMRRSAQYASERQQRPHLRAVGTPEERGIF